MSPAGGPAMPRRSFEVSGERPFLDLVSHGRRGPGERLQLLPAQIEQIARTVRHTPEVMVKISGGGGSAKAVAAHSTISVARSSRSKRTTVNT